MKIKFLIPVLLICFNLYSQDSTKVKLLNHEIGFNTISLIKQMVSNNPSSTLPQLPYAVFYNVYYKNLIGLRLGLGLTSNTIETKVSGQNDNKITKNTSQDVRLGLSYNFIRTKRFVANVFGDYVYNKNVISSTNTSTVQVFPDLYTDNPSLTKSSLRKGWRKSQCGFFVHQGLYSPMFC